ncbi:30S ribosomal protein S20 [candidate division SR1 bacterium Aalborg_AAW-1]|jgi:small subunit ribosomal protein S20|nr:30S ribosomal protein S20 [candidate division SR1 bacterium Aalborg_AAW-1]
MPITSSAKKAMRQSNKKRLVNKKFKDDLKISLNIFNKKVAKKEALSQEDVNTVYARIDKALKKGILHKNTAARRKALVAKTFNKAQA